MIRETIWWHAPREKLPDDDTTVLVCAPKADEPVWPGYRTDGRWYWADGSEVRHPVKGWAHLPAGG